MLLRPYLMLYRKRLIGVAVISVLFPLLALFITSAESLLDVRVLWDHFCGCPLDPTDASILLEPFFFNSIMFPIILGFSVGFAAVPTPGLQGETRMLLTRPIPRYALIVQPLLVAGLALGVLPVMGWLLLLGWLRLVHAPALGHLLALVEMAPAAASLGAHPSFLAVLAATHMGQRYLAALSVGLCLYAIFASQRWLLLQPNTRLRLLALFTFFIIYIPICVFCPLTGSARSCCGRRRAQV